MKKTKKGLSGIEITAIVYTIANGKGCVQVEDLLDGRAVIRELAGKMTEKQATALIFKTIAGVEAVGTPLNNSKG